MQLQLLKMLAGGVPFLCMLMLATGFLPSPVVAQTTNIHVALVFDDGPFPEHAPRLVELFNREDVHVTFGLVASKAQTNASTVLTILASGHEVANHSYAHRHPKELSDAELEKEIVEAQSILAKLCHGDGPRWYWPPFLETDDRVVATAKKAGIGVYPTQPIVVSGDYDKSVGSEEIMRRATTGVKDGSVILFHEWREETLAQLPAILKELRRQGCVFMTFSRLAAYKRSQEPTQEPTQEPAR